MSTWSWLEGSHTDVGDPNNMLFDEALLKAYLAGNIYPTVRLYHWDRNCVTIGRNQDLEQARGVHPYSAIYRRPTGGRAVQHGDDLTITVVADENSLRQKSSKSGILASYHVILSGLIDTITSHGIRSSMGSTRSSMDDINCFSSVGKCDVVDLDTGEKIVGCAQFRTQGAILQQISLRRHQRYHIDNAEFKFCLRENMGKRLGVSRWSTEDLNLPTEYLQSGILFG